MKPLRWTVHSPSGSVLGTYTTAWHLPHQRTPEAFFCPLCAGIWATAIPETPNSPAFHPIIRICASCGDGTLTASGWPSDIELDDALLLREFELELAKLEDNYHD